MTLSEMTFFCDWREYVTSSKLGMMPAGSRGYTRSAPKQEGDQNCSVFTLNENPFFFAILHKAEPISSPISHPIPKMGKDFHCSPLQRLST
jgi:hypothetical protein